MSHKCKQCLLLKMQTWVPLFTLPKYTPQQKHDCAILQKQHKVMKIHNYYWLHIAQWCRFKTTYIGHEKPVMNNNADATKLTSTSAFNHKLSNEDAQSKASVTTTYKTCNKQKRSRRKKFTKKHDVQMYKYNAWKAVIIKLASRNWYGRNSCEHGKRWRKKVRYSVKRIF